MLLGRYELLRKIASGGMADVYLARQRGPGGFDKYVALKRMHPHLMESGEMVASFLAEARIAAALRHPNVVDVYELGEQSGEYFIAMEWLPGRNMRQLEQAAGEQGKRISPGVAATLVWQAAQGLDHAHKQRGPDGRVLGVVHRDMSPHNVIVTWEGVAKVVDFGIALHSEADRDHEARFVRGKLRYMSPEQVRAGDVGPASDQFSLGIVLLEALAGKHPLGEVESNADAARAVADAKIPVGEIPEPFRSIVARALERQPGDRFPDLAAFAAAIEPLVAPARAVRETIAVLFPGGDYKLASEPWPTADHPTKVFGVQPERPPARDPRAELMQLLQDEVTALTRGPRVPWMKRLESALAASTLDPKMKAYGLLALGRGYRMAGEMTEAEEQFAEARRIADELRDGGIAGTADAELAISFRNQGRLAEARERFRIAMPKLRDAGDRVGEAIALGNLGIALALEDRHPEAQDLLERALGALSRSEAKFYEARFRGVLATSLHDVGRFGDARDAFRRSLSQLHVLGDQRFEGWVGGHLAFLLQEHGEHEAADKAYVAALQRLTAHKARLLEGAVRTRAALFALERSSADAAHEQLLAAFEALRDDGDPRARALVLAGLAAADAARASPSAAEESIGRALSLLGDARAPSVRVAIEILSATIEAARGDFASARQLAQKADPDGSAGAHSAVVRCARRILLRRVS